MWIILQGVGTLEEAKALYTEAKGLFIAASMNLREWSSNSEQLMESIPESDQAANVEQKILHVNGTYTITHYLYLVTPLTRLRMSSQRERYFT